MFKGKNYINGNWDKEIGGVLTRNPFGKALEVYENINPATGESVGSFPITDKHSVDYAVGAARATFECQT